MFHPQGRGRGQRPPREFVEPLSPLAVTAPISAALQCSNDDEADLNHPNDHRWRCKPHLQCAAVAMTRHRARSAIASTHRRDRLCEITPEEHSSWSVGEDLHGLKMPASHY